MKKDKTINLRVTEEQKKCIEAYAEDFGMDISELIRKALVSKAFEDYIDDEAKRILNILL